MRHATRCVFALALLLAAVLDPAHAADREGRFSIRGAGLLTCDAFAKERAARSKAYYMIGGWIDGYVTALNQATGDTYDVLSFESTELVAALLDAHCKTHPNDRVFSVINTLVGRLQPRRLEVQSPMVEVRVGERRVVLYQEVLRRSQHALAQRGLYKGPETGTFDDATRKAIAAFQKQTKFEPTGFPDQTTLMRLHADPEARAK